MDETPTRTVRMTMELGRSEQIEGVLSGAPWPEPQRFSGWLELLYLLEIAVTPAEPGHENATVVRLDPFDQPPDTAADPGSKERTR
jgi:hypothetical protein